MTCDRTRNHNPFRYLRPVPPDQFLGRWLLVKEMALDLTLDDGDSYACIGGRRFGKSSLLIALHHYLRTSEAQEGDHKALPLLLDFKRHNFQSETAFFAILLHEVRRRVDAGSRGRPKDPSPVKVPLDQNWLDALLTGDPPSLTLSRFEESLRYILDELYQSDGPTRLVLLLDEVDDTLRYPWHQVLFGHLRSLIYAGDLADSVRLVLAGSRHFLDEVTEQGSPLWNVLQLHYLMTFDEAATYQLMERAPDLSAAAQQAIWQQSGGHPFLAQYLLHHLWKAGIGQVDETTVTQVANHFLHEEQAHLEGWAKAIGTAGLRVYGHLVDQPGWVEEMELIRAAGDQNVSVKRTLVDLCYHGFVIHDGGWNRYRYTGDLLREWFLSQHQSQQKREGPGDSTGEEQEQSEFRYDVFVSYSHKDSAWVRNMLLPRLEAEGLHVCIDYRDFEPGAPILTEMERAVLESRKTLLVLTPAYLASEWAEFENILASTLDPAARRRRVIPLLLKPCELPLRIRTLTYLNFTGAESEFEFQRLVEVIRPKPMPDVPQSSLDQPETLSKYHIQVSGAQDVVVGDEAQVTRQFDVPPAMGEEGELSVIEEQAYLKRMLLKHRRNLHKLREQAAIYGAGEVPLRLLNQIESEKREIQRLQAQLTPQSQEG